MNKIKKIVFWVIMILISVLVCFTAIICAVTVAGLMNVTEIADNNHTNEIVNETIENEEIIDIKEAQDNNEETTQQNNVNIEDLIFELPINGATGYATKTTNIKQNNSGSSATVKSISAGDAFMIISEEDEWWYVDYNGTKGWVENTLCMINLPDIIPSIIYDDTNSYSSLFKSSGYSLQGITGQQLYNVKSYNERLGYEQYNMPVIYQMAKKIYEAQKLALENGDCLKIYETFRPYEVQMKVGAALSELANINDEVYNGINNSGWGESWFIAQKLSNHQLGVAMDVSIVKVKNKVQRNMNGYVYIEVTNYTEYEMPTDMHELSSKAATFKYPVSSASKTAWQSVPLATTMTQAAINLQNYCTSVGMSPLASEWWHFNDLDAKNTVKNNGINGKYYLNDSVSQKPE